MFQKLLGFWELGENGREDTESEEKSAKDCSTKPPPNRRPKLQHESSYGGSNV